MNNSIRILRYVQLPLNEEVLAKLPDDAQKLIRLVHKANAFATTLGGITLSGPVLSQWRVATKSSEGQAWNLVERLRRTDMLGMYAEGGVEYLAVGWRLGSPDLELRIQDAGKPPAPHPERVAAPREETGAGYTKLSTANLSPADALKPSVGPRQQGRDFTQIPSLVTRPNGEKVSLPYRPPVHLSSSGTTTKSKEKTA